MLRHRQIKGVLYAALTATGLFLTSCTQDRIEPAPVSFRGVTRAINSSGPVVSAPLIPPRSVVVLAHPSAASATSATAHRRMPASGHRAVAVSKGKRSASAHKMHIHRAPQMAGVVRGTTKAHRTAKPAGSATTLARSHPEGIPLDEPVTRAAEQTTPAWVQPAPAETPQQQLRPPAP